MLESNTISPFITPRCHGLTRSHQLVKATHAERATEIRWTKTAGSVSDRFQDSSVFNQTLHIAKILRTQGGRYYCKAENGLGSPAIKSIRVDVYYALSTCAHAHTHTARVRTPADVHRDSIIGKGLSPRKMDMQRSWAGCSFPEQSSSSLRNV
ncbi:unnamed protein product [Pleuronectes platessa]|uniref:Ig-like domain-containing protein n=1 Tax=Pleuronectes platessa TaxID=8262 RepID=A0A9N7YMH9_PLEPL|nr:unnamed protein product [Pleuronectes platessa]